MVIQLQKGSLGPTLQNLGTILGKALEQRGKLQQQQNILKMIAGGGSKGPVSDIAKQRASSPISAFEGGEAPPSGIQQPIVEGEEFEEKTPQGEMIEEKGAEAAPLPQFNLPYSKEQRALASVFAPEMGKAMDAANQEALETQKLQQKEQAQIRKEDREEIKKYAAPFQDLSKMKTTVNKLEKAKDLIQNRKVSLDQNQFRRLATAILEDKGWDSIAQYFKTDEQKLLFALLKDYFSTKDVGGSNPSTKEVLLSLSTLPSENLGYEANLGLINTLLDDAQTRLFKGEKILDLRKTGRQFGFGEFQDIVEKNAEQRMSPVRQKYQKESQTAQLRKQFQGKRPQKGYVFGIGPDGTPLQVPKSKQKIFEKDGGEIINVD